MAHDLLPKYTPQQLGSKFSLLVVKFRKIVTTVSRMRVFSLFASQPTRKVDCSFVFINL